jgi:hypothetical protein
VLDTAAYASGDRLGSIVTLTNVTKNTGGISRLVGLTVLDKEVQSQAFDILFFNASPTVASADNAAIDITDAEMAKCVGRVTVGTANYVATASNSVATVNDINCYLKAVAGQSSLYALLVCRSGTPTYAAGSLVLSLTFEQVA